MKFSVLICTYNRHEVLGRALEALINRTEEKPDEVVIVNGGDSRTDEVVQRYLGKGVEVKLIRTTNKNLAASRNIGLPECTGDIIGMTDDDAEVFPDWVSQMKAAHKAHPEAGAVGGTVIAIDRRPLACRLAEKVTFPSWPGPRYIRTLPTVNLSYKAEIIRLIGAQDEEMWTGEDVDYNWRMIKAGYSVYFDPSICVYHNHPNTLRELWFKHFTYGRGYYLVRHKWADMYCIYPHDLRTTKGWLKLGNFAAATFYRPLFTSVGMRRFEDKLLGLPVLLVNELATRCGLINQYVRTKRGVLGR